MAIKTSFVFVAIDKITANAKKIAKSVDKVADKFKKADGAAEKTSKSFSKFADTGIGKFKELAVAAGAFFGAKQFLETGSAFQDQIAELSAITGAAGEDLSFLSDEALRLSKTSVIAQDQVAEAFKLIASAKDDLLKDPKGLSRVTEQVLLLANASKVELGVAAEFVGQALNQFGQGADQAARFVNVMAAGAKEGASEVEDTGTALLKVGVVAKQAGLSFEQTNGLLQTLAAVGPKAEVAGTGLSAVLIRLSRLGINFKNTGLSETFVKIREKLALVSDETQKAELIFKLFGTEHQKTGLILLENAERIDEFTKKLTGTNTAQEQAAVNMDTFSVKVRRLGISINDALIRTFLRLEPQLSKMVVGFTDFLDNIDTEQIDSIVFALSSLLDVVTLLAKGGAFVTSVFKGVGTAIGEQVGALATGDILPRADTGTSFTDAFSIGGRFLGFGEKSLTGGAAKTENNVLDLNLNISGDTSAIKSISTKSKGPAAIPVKTNMATS